MVKTRSTPKLLPTKAKAPLLKRKTLQPKRNAKTTSTSTSSRAAVNSRSLSRESKNALLDPMVKQIIENEAKQKDSKVKNNYGIYNSLYLKHKDAYPWLTANLIRKRVQNYKKKQQMDAAQHINALTQPQSSEKTVNMPTPIPGQALIDDAADNMKVAPTPPPQKKLTNKEKEHIAHCSKAAMNEVTTLYAAEQARAMKENKRVKKGFFNNLVDDVRTKQNLPPSFQILF